MSFLSAPPFIYCSYKRVIYFPDMIYPGVLLLGIICATIFATGQIKRIHIREMNNME